MGWENCVIKWQISNYLGVYGEFKGNEMNNIITNIMWNAISKLTNANPSPFFPNW